MLSKPPEQLPAILFVDDEEKTCKHFQRLFSNRFRIITAHNGLTAMDLFREQHEDIGIIVTDQRMPNENGTEFLQKACALKPSVKRILSTAYADVDSAIEAVNAGGIYRYITKPWEVSELEVTLMRAMELFLIERERESLLHQKVANVETLAATERVHSLAALAVFKESGLRNISPAMGSLIQLGQPDSQDSSTPLQWDQVYQSHRQFLDLAHAALPNNLTEGPEFAHNQNVSTPDLFEFVKKEIPRLQIATGEPGSERFPGPIDTLGPLFVNLVQSFINVLAETDQISLHHGKQGPELRFSTLPIRHALRSMFETGTSTIEQAQPCLGLVAGVINWHHHGGSLQVTHDVPAGTTRLTLKVQMPKSHADPWHNLASDLIANDSFWKRQL